MLSFVINLVSAVSGAVLLLFSTVYLSVTLQDSTNGKKAASKRGFLVFLAVVLFAFGVFLLVKGVDGSIEMYLLEGL